MAWCLRQRIGVMVSLNVIVFLCVVGLELPTLIDGFSTGVPLTSARALAGEVTFPPDAGLVSVNAYGATGDGKTDDTAAMQRAIDSLRERQTLYLPNGTYLVSQTLIYPSKSRHLITQGQSRDATIIRLKDGTAGFDDPDHPKPVVQTRDGNTAFGYRFLNLTLDVGSGNPGASGIDYISNNEGAISHVRIMSSDPDRRGARGIDMSRPWPGPALIKHVQIEGFDYGLYLDRGRYSMTVEHLTLRGQHKAGIRNLKNVMAIRGLTSANGVPVLQNSNGTATIIDGKFEGGRPSVSAIEHDGRNKGALFARNIVASGYRSAIQDNGEAIPGNTIAEYTSESPRHMFSRENQRSLNLQVEETPDVPWDAGNHFEQWVNVIDFGARPNDGRDDSDAVQQAINAANKQGKTTIYLPTGEYHFAKTIRVWGSVRRVLGMLGPMNISGPLMSAKGPLFRLERGQDVVVFERMLIRMKNRSREFEMIDHAAPNTVVFKHGRGGIYRNTVTGGRAFFEDWSSYLRITGPQAVWARQWNPETGNGSLTRAVNDAGTLWVLMMKTEGHGTHVENKHGGQVEILGMLSGWIDADTGVYADFINNESQLSVSGFRPAYKQVVVETRKGQNATLYDEKPRFTALYVGRR